MQEALGPTHVLGTSSRVAGSDEEIRCADVNGDAAPLPDSAPGDIGTPCRVPPPLRLRPTQANRDDASAVPTEVAERADRDEEPAAEARQRPPDVFDVRGGDHADRPPSGGTAAAEIQGVRLAVLTDDI